MSDAKKIRSLKSKIRKAKRTLRREIKKADADNIRTPSEQADIDFIEAKVQEFEENLLEAEGKLKRIEFSDDETDTIIANAPTDWSDTGKVRLHYNNQIQDWISQVRNELNTTHNQYNDTENKTKFGVNDVLALAGLIPVIGTYVGMFSTIKSVTENFLKAALSSSKVTFKQLHSDLDAGFEKYYKSDYDKEFAKFKEAFEREHERYSQADVIKEITQLKKKLPTKAIAQKLVAKLLNNVVDGYDWNDYAGVLEIRVECLIPVWDNDYTFPKVSGYIDDANEALLNATQHAFKGKRAIDLPIPIIVTVVDSISRGAMILKLKRTSKEPGNDDFKKIDSNGRKNSSWILDKFNQVKPHRSLKVSKLKVE